MTPGIGSSGANSAARQAALSARPQVQTRRVSVQFGPLGISYSTDQVVWGQSGAAQAEETSVPEASASPLVMASPLAAAGGAEAPPVDSVARVGSWKAGADAAHDSGPSRFGDDFGAALEQAWSTLAAGLAASSTYDRSGALRDSSVRADAEGTLAGSAQTGAAAGTDASAQSAADVVSAKTQEREVQEVSGQAPFGQADRPEGKRPAAARVRRAIGAYLACAEGFAATRPMLQITA